MAKKERIYESKTDKRKTKNLSIRTTEEVAAEIDKKAEEAKLNRNDFICLACQQCNIIVIPEGQEILQAVQETRNLIRTLQVQAASVNEADAVLGKVILRLRDSISPSSQD